MILAQLSDTDVRVAGPVAGSVLSSRCEEPGHPADLPARRVVGKLRAPEAP